MGELLWWLEVEYEVEWIPARRLVSHVGFWSAPSLSRLEMLSVVRFIHIASKDSISVKDVCRFFVNNTKANR